MFWKKEKEIESLKKETYQLQGTISYLEKQLDKASSDADMFRRKFGDLEVLLQDHRKFLSLYSHQYEDMFNTRESAVESNKSLEFGLTRLLKSLLAETKSKKKSK